MSRVYRISVSDSVRQHVEIKDGVRSNIELLPVLPAERMRALLEAELQARGFECNDGVAVRLQDYGIRISIDMENSTIEITLAQSVELHESVELSRMVEEEVAEEKKAQLEQQLPGRLQDKLDAGRLRARQVLTQKLKSRLGDIQRELDQLINATISAALKEKAAQLGEIEEIVESEDGSISIRVNL